MVGVECDSVMVESENRDQWIAGDEGRELKHRRLESTDVDCDNVVPTVEDLMWEVEMNKVKLEEEREVVEELSQEVDKLREIMREDPFYHDEYDRPLRSFEIYKEMTKQYRAFEKRLRDLKIRFSETLIDVRKKTYPYEHQYPLLKDFDKNFIIKVRLEKLELIEAARIVREYRKEIFKKIVRMNDFIKLKFEDFKYLNPSLGSSFDDSRLEALFKNARLMIAPHVMLAEGHVMLAEGQTGEELKDFVWKSLETSYSCCCKNLENWSVKVSIFG
ncbi:hypothetical protein QJS10_CPB17g02402 [Acorus calamus]|uniref:Uncharacterized protein n=1 Tax=Acorus calamus TaxID=4465 RepID=A0AAV9CV03_ACOCL|nr:hypothetical protein QJS10_CPB17g02402 [Acorus calamus]